MSKATKPPENVSVLLVAKDESDTSGGWASAYGVTHIEIDKSILLSYGKVISKSEPDVFNIFESNIIKKCREIFKI